MVKKPLILKDAVKRTMKHDASTSDEELPGAITKNADGFVVSRQTTHTRVTQETTDDN